MKLVASAIVRNERGRYLEPWLNHLLEFCDAVAVFDDASTDGTFEYVRDRALADDQARVAYLGVAESEFDAHEGRARQRLLDFTLRQEPTHVLAIDADEFVTDGPALRQLLDLDARANVWTLEMAEIYAIDGDCLCARHDGHWRPYKASVAWRVPQRPEGLRIADRQLACGRIPGPLPTGRGGYTNIGLLHFGWTNPAERRRRFDRYMRIDGGRFHNLQHLKSAGPDYPEDLVELEGRPWPPALAAYRPAITERAVRTEP